MISRISLIAGGVVAALVLSACGSGGHSSVSARDEGTTTTSTSTTTTTTTVPGSTAPPVSSTPASTAPTMSGFQAVVYGGLRFQVPDDWPVYDLAKDPTRCVRFDQHAVYLGHPGADQRCPAHLVGRTTALLIEPNDASAEASSADADSGTRQAVSANGRALITASYGTGG